MILHTFSQLKYIFEETEVGLRMFDVCVIGAGLIGSSAAKYLSGHFGKVVLIGPEEPDRTAYSNHAVFGAHYDEGRIATVLEDEPVQSVLHKETIRRYKDIEEASGIQFYRKNGGLLIVDRKYSHLISSINKNVAERFGISYRHLPTSLSVQQEFPYFTPLPNMQGILETEYSGTVNPRKLIQAQIKLASLNGCSLVRDIVCGIVHQESDNTWIVKTKDSGTILARKVFICPGGFLFHLTERPEKLGRVDLRPRTAVAARIRVDDKSLNQRLIDSMPNVFFHAENNYDNALDPHAVGLSFYMLAPVKYPDGHWYLKLGMDLTAYINPYFKTPQEISEWYRNGRHTERAIKEGELLKQSAKSFIPELDVSNVVLDTCAISVTPTRRAYIDEVEENLFIACGGNGVGAMSCDKLGRLAALLCSGGGTSQQLGQISRDSFRCEYQQLSKRSLAKL